MTLANIDLQDVPGLIPCYVRERERLLSNCHAHREGMGLGRHSRKQPQRELAVFRANWAQVRTAALAVS